MQMSTTAENRRTGLVVCGVSIAVLLVGVLGVLLAHHLSPCNPRNIGRCGRRLASTLQGLDGVRLSADQEAAALCPATMEALDCYYWFSQRCLPSREQRFYANVYLDSSAVVDGLCRPQPPDLPLLLTHGPCLRAARGQRLLCSDRFHRALEDHGDREDVVSCSRRDDGVAASLVDSLYDPDAVGTFQVPLCRAIREFILCSLQLVSDHCGLNTALHVQDLHNNLTDHVFKNKCDINLRPLLTMENIAFKTVDMIPSTHWFITLFGLLLLVLLLVIGLVRSHY